MEKNFEMIRNWIIREIQVKFEVLEYLLLHVVVIFGEAKDQIRIIYDFQILCKGIY